MQPLQIYNTLSREKEIFEPVHSPHVGMYVCGPTVYSDAHLGHARHGVTFDLLFRYLKHIGYKVRYVRNITDVGHLENEEGSGEDKIAKKARLEQLEPMEVVQYYLIRYHEVMNALNTLPPSIEPLASGHIIEQIQSIQKILDNGYAYESDGSVYFDVEKYNKDFDYGILSHRNIDELLNTTRELDGQQEKKNKVDFALWKKASPEHIMRWSSPWSIGFPGWHLECSTMSMKYLGTTFDIHGGGLDLMFPHHECEIAQNTAIEKHQVVKYWMHNNMITIGGQKMARSLNNFITLEQLFSGDHSLLEKAYSPMVVRFFILQAHYRSTVDFSNEALLAAEKGLNRLLDAYRKLEKIKTENISTEFDIKGTKQKCYDALNDDLNSAIVISLLFDLATLINSAYDEHKTLSASDVENIKEIFDLFLFQILGLKNESSNNQDLEPYNKAIDLLLELRDQAKSNKDWTTSDKIRNKLSDAGFDVKDGKNGVEWKLK